MGGSRIFQWNNESEAELRKLNAEGLSFAEIAKELGCSSRNAVIGKAHRLGLVRRGKSTKPASIERSRAPRKRPESKMVQRIISTGASATVIMTTTMQEPIESKLSPDDIPIKQRKQLLELAHDGCRWPYGDPGKAGFFFCGADTLPERSYCEAHCRVASAGRPQLRSIVRAPRMVPA